MRVARRSNRLLAYVLRTQPVARQWATLVAVGAIAERRERELGPRDDGGRGAAVPRSINVIELRARCLGVMRVAA
jgi:hypothetical protein